MKTQWMRGTIAISLVLSLTACELDGGGSDDNQHIVTNADVGTTDTSGYGGPIPDSGQTSCYYDYTIEDIDYDGADDIYNPTANYCLDEYSAIHAYGQDGNFSINPLSYTDNGDGTVLDNVTGLTWQKCALGESGSDCTLGSISSYSWDEAGSECSLSTLAGGGWRLPSVTELMSIVNYGKSFGTIDYATFPGGTVTPYWTSNPHALYSSWAWYVNFSEGAVGVDDKVDTHYVRCVRG